MKNEKFILFFIISMFIFHFINSKNQQKIKNVTFTEIINRINSQNELKEENYIEILNSVIGILNDYYVYLDIEKTFEFGNENNMIEKLKKVETKNVKYYKFMTDIIKIIRSAKDPHLSIQPKSFLNYSYISPICYQIKKENDDYKVGYYIKDKDVLNLYDNNLKKKINENINKTIKKINGEDPIDYIQKFGRSPLLKEPHGIFSFNLKIICEGSLLTAPFEENDLMNIRVELDDQIFTFNYTLKYLDTSSFKFLSFFEEKMNEALYLSLKPTIMDIEKQYYSFKNNITVKDTKFWDYDYEGKLKFKVDKNSEVNVMYHNSFMFKNLVGLQDVLIKIMNELSSNKYPIIIIEHLNPGGYVSVPFTLEKILNYKSSMTKFRLSTRITNNSKKIYDLPEFNRVYDIETCKEKKGEGEEEIDKYDDKIIHKRTKVFSLIDTYLFSLFKPDKIIERNSSDIIVFTDGFSVSASSIFIQDLQESGNAIIVGYNGNPSQSQKDELFNSGNSPSPVISNILNDKNFTILKKYNITFTVTAFETFDDSYINKSKNEFLIPKEYLKFNIDYRSDIYGSYSDEKYMKFINYSKTLFGKLKEQCPKNTNIFQNIKKCKFENHTYTGYKCGNDNKWVEACVPIYCEEGYFFDTKNKICKINQCYVLGKKRDRFYALMFILLVLVISFGLSYYIYKKFQNFETNVKDISSSLLPSIIN